jgi:long-chain acyl-CoA synthetase
MPTLRHIAVLREGRRTELPAGVVDLETIMAAASPSDPPQPFRPDDVAAIFHTSGTTGLPKGAAQTHVNIVVGARQMAYFTGYRMLAERQVCPLPLFNNFGSTAVMNLNVNCLGSIALLERWDTAAVLDAFVRLGCNRFMGTPTMFIYLLQGHDPAVHGEVALGRCLVAGQKCPPEVRAAFEERFSCRLIDAYGATETHFITSMTAHGDNPEGTVGHPVGHATVRVEDDSGAEVGPGVVGELVLGADTVCAGYWRNPEKTAESFGPHGWRSGDLGFRDENGFYHIVDRKKDLIITGGMNIYPAEIEAVLYEHPGVAVATVIGMPDEVKGEIPRAYVVPKDGSEVTPAEILAWCREKMAVYKVPRDVVFMAELPLSPVGKVLKRELREQLLAQIG